MNYSPYDLYIQFEKIESLIKREENNHAKILSLGIASIETSCNLLAFQAERVIKNDRLVLDLFQGINTQFEILNSFNWSIDFKGEESFSQDCELLKSLPERFSKEIDCITEQYFSLSRKINIGIDDQFNEIRTHFGLAPLKSDTNSNESKESALLTNSVEFDVPEYFNSEDQLFMRTHQISEFWFEIVIQELELIQTKLKSKNQENLSSHFDMVNMILSFLSKHIMILEHMVLSDYHPLRVALRGASGGQSMQAYKMFRTATQAFDQFSTNIKQEENTIVNIIEKPQENANSLRIVNHFSDLEQALKNFFFQHYMLSSRIIGSESFGSIGKDLVSLTDKFVDPIFKEIDDAKYHLTLKTNFQYGAFAGKIVMEKEVPPNPSDRTEISNYSDVEDTITHYFEAISALDMDRWVQLFHRNGFIEDPVGSRPYIGHKQLEIFFKGVIRFFKELKMSTNNVDIKDGLISVHWSAEAIAFNDSNINFNGIEVFQFNASGKIQEAKVYWSPSMISDQL